jgi:hypothetical protein
LGEVSIPSKLWFVIPPVSANRGELDGFGQVGPISDHPRQTYRQVETEAKASAALVFEPIDFISDRRPTFSFKGV